MLEPRTIALWALPPAIAAFIIHATRIHALQRRLSRERAEPRSDDAAH
jgi:uncharacterized membrane protein